MVADYLVMALPVIVTRGSRVCLETGWRGDAIFVTIDCVGLGRSFRVGAVRSS